MRISAGVQTCALPIYDAGVDGPAGLVAHAPALESARAHRLDHRVSTPDEVEEHLAATVGAEIEHHRPLAPADVEVHERGALDDGPRRLPRSEEHTSELQSLMRISYAVFCLKKKKTKHTNSLTRQTQ